MSDMVKRLASKPFRARVQDLGRITIPDEIRVTEGIEKGSFVDVTVEMVKSEIPAVKVDPALIAAINGVGWKEMRDKKGSWAYSRDIEGKPLPEVQPLVDAILDAPGKRLVFEDETFELYGDSQKFISRRPRK